MLALMRRRGMASAFLGAAFLVAATPRVDAYASSGARGRFPTGLPQAVQSRLDEAERAATFRRDLDAIRFRSREALFIYFMDHAEIAASVGKALGVSEYRIERRPDGSYRCDDGRGASGTVEILFSDARHRLLYGAGAYSSKWLPTLRVRGMMVVEFDHIVDSDGHPNAVVGATAFVEVENHLLKVLVRLSRPFLSGVVDGKIARALRLAKRVSELAYDDPEGFLGSLRKSGKIDQGITAELARRLSAGTGGR